MHINVCLKYFTTLNFMYPAAFISIVHFKTTINKINKYFYMRLEGASFRYCRDYVTSAIFRSFRALFIVE
jgi:hypothetical protein